MTDYGDRISIKNQSELSARLDFLCQPLKELVEANQLEIPDYLLKRYGGMTSEFAALTSRISENWQAVKPEELDEMSKKVAAFMKEILDSKKDGWPGARLT